MSARRLTGPMALAVLLGTASSIALAQDDPQEHSITPVPSIEAEEEEPDSAEAPGDAQSASAAAAPDCAGLPDHATLRSVLRKTVTPNDPSTNGGLGNHMWAAIVNREGQICAIGHSGENVGDQWPGSRAIAAAKATTANGVSLPGFALSTANIYWASQPGGFLYGIETSNPANPELLAQGPTEHWGTENDPLVGQRAGGTVVFAGGLALYSEDDGLLGAIGLSGDESCTDHVIAWKIRYQLDLDHVPDGVTANGNDNIIYDIVDDPSVGRRKSASGYGHPECSPRAKAIAEEFEQSHPTGTQ